MKSIKLAILAVTVAGVALSAADARPPHRHKVCQTKWVHHHKVSRCFWR